MGVYDRQIALATRLIKAKGQLVTWRQMANGATATPWKPGAAVNTDYPTYIVFLPDTRENRASLHYSRESEIIEGDYLGLMLASDFEPTLNAVVLRDSVQMTVKNVTDLAPNGEKIMYYLELKI